MDLWTEYEGRTIAGDYYLESLLRSEGRSAFFATHGTAEQSAVIRLTEAHFDEAEMLQRWRHIAAVEQGNLIEIRQVGQTTLDGVALTYALLEPSDASLGDVLKERPLTTAETTEVARAVVAALSALHGNGLVHEHIEPANVLAVEETVKLRSDCVRECVVDMEFSTAEDCEELRRRDRHDLGVLLLQCLTLGREWQPGLKLALPFQQLIPGALDGSWTLEKMASALATPPVPSNGRPASYAARLPDPPAPVAGVPAPVEEVAAPARLVPATALLDRATTPSTSTPLQQDAALPGATFRPRNDLGLAPPARPVFRQLWVVALAGLALLLLLGWLLFGKSSKPAPAPAVAAPAASTPSAQVKPSAALADRPATPLPPKVVVTGPAAPKAGWYVVAFTYNHRDQAAAKAAQVQKKHADLQPQVFTPKSGAPFLVTLGGPMTNGDAGAMLRRARQSGMPRDTFVRNY